MEDLHCWQSKFESCCYSYKLISKIILLNEQTDNKVDLNEIKKAIYYAKKYHGSQKRLSGEPYYTHPIEVAYNIADYRFTTDILITSILHDTLEDTKLTKEVITYIFDSNIANQVEALTRIKTDQKIDITEAISLIWSQKNRENLLLIKYFDRLHNMQTINVKSKAKIKKISEETLKEFIIIEIWLGERFPAILKMENLITGLCYNNLSTNLYLVKNHKDFFEDNFQFLFPDFQNDLIPKCIQ